MNENEERFNFSYSAKQQEEIRKIRDKYVPREENKLDRLRRLDADASKPGTIVSIIMGVIGVMLLGTGMSCTMVWGADMFIPGVIIGIIGIAVTAGAYPAYTRITRKRRDKIAPEILRLTEELSQRGDQKRQG